MTNTTDKAMREALIKQMQLGIDDPMWPHHFEIHKDTARRIVKALASSAAAPEQAELTTCNCRWNGDTQVQRCTLHEAHVQAIHEWAERAKTAEAAQAQPAPRLRPAAPLSEPTAEGVQYRQAMAVQIIRLVAEYGTLCCRRQDDGRPSTHTEVNDAEAVLRTLIAALAALVACVPKEIDA